METFINEKSMRFEALQQLREIQANLVGVSFLPVIAVMKEENPLKKSVLSFQDDLDDLTMKVQKFISEAKNGVDYSEEEEAPDGDGDEPDAGDEEGETDGDEGEENDDENDDKEVEDSSEPKE